MIRLTHLLWTVRYRVEFTQSLDLSVYFEAICFTDEASIGTPLNKAAAEYLKQAAITPNVPYSIKDGADLNETREIGSQACYELR